MFSIKFLTVKQTPLLYSLYFYLKYFKWNRCHFQVTDFVAHLHLYYKFILFKRVANHFCKEINLTFSAFCFWLPPSRFSLEKETKLLSMTCGPYLAVNVLFPRFASFFLCGPSLNLLSDAWMSLMSTW